MDLGATPWTTWRLVTFPALRGALLAGALLAFALSFDEIVVTTFTAGPGLQTLPLWIFQNLFRPNQARSSTSPRPCWCSSRCCRCTWPTGSPADTAGATTK